MGSSIEKASHRPSIAALVLAALLLPIGVVLYSYEWEYSWYVQVIAMTYMINIDSYSFFFNPGPVWLLATLPFSFLRIGFLYMIWRAYNGKTTRRRAIIVGLVAEIWFPLLYMLPYLLTIVLSPMPFMYFPIAIPIPLLLVLGFVLLGLSPPPGLPTSWRDEDPPQNWWDEKSSTSSEQ